MTDPHRHHRNLGLSVDPPPRIPTSRPFPLTPSSASTPSKQRRSTKTSSSSSFSSLLLLLFSLRSLYSLFPFIRSAPSSFSLFPFSFLVSLLSSLLSLLALSLSDPHLASPQSLKSLSLSHLRPLSLKSLLLTLTFLLHFQAIRYCGASPTILADLSGSLLAASFSPRSSPRRRRRIPGLAALAVSFSLLSFSWDHTGCFPLSSHEGCFRLLPMLLPFLSGFLSFHERASSNWDSLRQLGRKRVRVASLFLTTGFLFVPALVSFFLVDRDTGAASFGDLGWPLINTVIFGVILSENHRDDKAILFSARDFRREFMVTFFCTLLLELFYFPNLSLPGFLFCGFLLWIAVRELGSSSLSYYELGSSVASESLYSMIMKPVRHILTERKSRKIALFLLINTAYMVVEFVAGFMSNSLGLISDACHMLFDCAALAIGLYASYISRLPANEQFNYGRGRFEVLSGYVNAVFLVLVGALIVLESLERILDPQEISTSSLLVVSVGGLLVNLVGLVFFHEEHHHAHGGAVTCSHSHSHHPSHHHHDHHDGNGGYVREHDAEHKCCLVVPHETSNGHSNIDSRNQCSNHQDNWKDEFKTDTDLGKPVNHHDHKCQSHEHDHHSNGQKHDCQEDPHRADSQSHHRSSKGKDDHQVPFQGDMNDILGDKNDCSHEEPHNAAHMSKHDHSHSTLSKELHGKGSMDDSRKRHHIDHNMEGIFLHVLADTLGSVGVVISTLLIKYKGWLIADPACSIFISVMIISSVLPLLMNSAEILLQRVPRAHEHDLKVALDDLKRIKGVCSVQNVHVWNFTNTEVVGTVHLHVSPDTDKASVKNISSETLHKADIKDVTIQVECMKV